jgi:hypothetical protein
MFPSFAHPAWGFFVAWYNEIINNHNQKGISQ